MQAMGGAQYTERFGGSWCVSTSQHKICADMHNWHIGAKMLTLVHAHNMSATSSAKLVSFKIMMKREMYEHSGRVYHHTGMEGNVVIEAGPNVFDNVQGEISMCHNGS